MSLQPQHSKPATNHTTNLVREALALHERHLIAYACSILSGDEQRARDVVQDTFLKLHLADPNKVRTNLRSWLYAVCRNRAFDVLRKENRIQFMDAMDHLETAEYFQTSPADQIIRYELLDQIWDLLEILPTSQQEVIRLKFQHGLSYKEISNVTQLSITNVGFQLHTAIKRLRKFMDQRSHSLESSYEAIR